MVPLRKYLCCDNKKIFPSKKIFISVSELAAAAAGVAQLAAVAAAAGGGAGACSGSRYVDV